MPIESAADNGQFGLLDLSVDLSVPEVYSGTDFTLYLHVKNPFASRIWIRKVELSLPTQLKWRPMAKFNEQVSHEGTSRPDGPFDSSGRTIPRRRWWQAKPNDRQIRLTERRIANLLSERNKLGAGKTRRERRISHELSEQYAILQRLELPNASWIETNVNASVQVDHAETKGSLILKAAPGSSIQIGRLNTGGDVPGRLLLHGSLPDGAALEPGCTDVWTIRLGSAWSPFFIPAQYKLQMTVVYSSTPPPPKPDGATGKVRPVHPGAGREFGDEHEGDPGDRDRRDGTQTGSEKFYSNTTAATVQVKAALWAVITGGVIGGIIGSAGRSLQDAKSFSVLFGAQLGSSLGALVLAIILSGAGIVFAARKSNAQAFISVEDFWGGLLVGFLIGYSGTAAFSSITGIPA